MGRCWSIRVSKVRLFPLIESERLMVWGNRDERECAECA